MKLTRAIWSGVAGALVAVLLFLGAHYALAPASDPSAVLGDMVWADGGWVAWAIGAIAQLVLGAVAGVAYALVFEFVFRHAGVLVGLAVAVPHVVIAGMAVAWLPVGSTPNAVPPVGAFMAFEGALAAAWFIVTHLAFGAVVGACYGATRHRPSAPRAVWHTLADEAAEREASI